MDVDLDDIEEEEAEVATRKNRFFDEKLVALCDKVYGTAKDTTISAAPQSLKSKFEAIKEFCHKHNSFVNAQLPGRTHGRFYGPSIVGGEDAKVDDDIPDDPECVFDGDDVAFLFEYNDNTQGFEIGRVEKLSRNKGSDGQPKYAPVRELNRYDKAGCYHVRWYQLVNEHPKQGSWYHLPLCSKYGVGVMTSENVVCAVRMKLRNDNGYYTLDVVDEKQVKTYLERRKKKGSKCALPLRGNK